VLNLNQAYQPPKAHAYEPATAFGAGIVLQSQQLILPTAHPLPRRRLPAARAQKSDTDQDFKLILDQMLQDLLEVACLPEWPAATVLLLRFITTLNGPKGLQHGGGQG
jgi:hypothetical protein